MKTAGASIHAEHLGKVFRSQQHQTAAFADLSFDVRAGEFLCILGPSGCGKSTLLNVINGLERPSSGQLQIRSSHQDPADLRIGMVFQDHGLFPWLSLLKNIRLILDNQPRFLHQDTADLSRQHLQRVGLEHFADYYPHQVSGGMRQRAAIARSFAVDPDILLLDEPFVFLDYQTRLQLQQMLQELLQGSNKTVVFVTHDIEEAVLLADRIMVLSAHPGHIRDIIEVPLTRPRSLFELKQSAQFNALVQQAGSLIQDELARLGEKLR